MHSCLSKDRFLFCLPEIHVCLFTLLQNASQLYCWIIAALPLSYSSEAVMPQECNQEEDFYEKTFSFHDFVYELHQVTVTSHTPHSIHKQNKEKNFATDFSQTDTDLHLLLLYKYVKQYHYPSKTMQNKAVFTSKLIIQLKIDS